MERCPNCRARIQEDPICRRCGMDLALLLAVEAAAAERLRAAISRLAAGDAPAASATLRQSLALCQDPLAASLLGLLAAEPQAKARALGAPAESPPPDDWYLT
ncbi:MAG: hypothetical protein KA125_09555 [Chromatiaceae bacterium]|nr:hypothetical protein [Chromatiaceae bacterium]MBP9603752.1 hypothetical protein [Chromatiaceae bacterium]